MLKGVLAGKGHILLCGNCMDVRGLSEDEILDRARRSTMGELADGTMTADRVLVF